VKASQVDFNGVGDNAHEPFEFPGEEESNACKTEFKPYDEVVTACLLVAHDHFPSSVLTIASDGSWGDWQDGARLYTSVTGRRAANPMSGNMDDLAARAGLAVRATPALLGAVIWWLKKRRKPL
jgi:hypothetical protein